MASGTKAITNGAVQSRRAILLGGLATLAACGAPVPNSGARSAAPAVQRARIQANPAFDAWVAGFRPRALAQGISARTFDGAFAGAGYLPGVVERDRNQFQARRSVEDYIALASSDDRIAGGKAAMRKHQTALNAISQRYGVLPELLTALWGVESRYGTRRGDWPVVPALATLAFDGRRGRFFESQLIAALKILERRETRPQNMLGSWAGAMGHTQFIPSTYLAYAVDFDGDGRRDIWHEDSTDALASAAAYLSRSGWQAAAPWAFEVRAPDGTSAATKSGAARRQSYAAWASAGLRRADGRALPSICSAALIRPGGAVGPYFLLGSNFRALLRYNASDSYALAVGHLADRLVGGRPFAQGFGPDATGLTLSQRKEVQQLLNHKGYDAGTVDGVFGKQTNSAIAAYQAAQGSAVTGTPSRSLLAALRSN